MKVINGEPATAVSDVMFARTFMHRRRPLSQSFDSCFGCVFPARPTPLRARASSGLLTALCIAITVACAAPHTVAARPEQATAPLRDPYARIDRWIAAAKLGFHSDDAMALVRIADRGFRMRGNEAYSAVLDATETSLRAGGFIDSSASVGRELLASSALIWDARSGLLETIEPDRRPLLRFDAGNDVNRTMLVAYSIGGDVSGEVDFGTGTDSLAGRVLLTDRPAGAVERRAVERGAVAVLSAAVEAVNDTAHHPDTVRYDTLPGDRASAIPLINVSPQVAADLRAAHARGKVVVHVHAGVSLRTGNAQTLVARIAGHSPDAAPIVLVAHVDEPGANDNGSGVGTLAQAAVTYLRMIQAGTVPPPERSVVFLFGTEMDSSIRWIETHPSPRPAFALAVDMAGEGPEIAPMLIERMPDPGAMRARDFDAHSAWFSGGPARSVAPGSFLTAYAISVFGHVDRSWPVHDHPFEGGSDHVPFLTRSIPALLFWHFPDDAYHTNRDRLARVSAAEMSRVASGLIALMAHGAAAGETEALEVVDLTLAYALARIEREAVAARVQIANHGADQRSRDAAMTSERAHLWRWGRHLEQSIGSCAAFPVRPSDAVTRAITTAVTRVNAATAAAAASLL